MIVGKCVTKQTFRQASLELVQLEELLRCIGHFNKVSGGSWLADSLSKR
jgi:hypothetical protein